MRSTRAMQLTSIAKLFCGLSLFGALCACVQIPQAQTNANNNLTHGQVTLSLKKLETTQTEVLEKFGAPNLVTSNAFGEESWTYQRHATVAEATSISVFATIILAGASSSRSGFEQSTRSMTLIIKFQSVNGVKVVSDFSSRSSSF